MAFELRRSADWPARVIGLAVFLTGVGLLVLVFIWANQSLGAPALDTKKPPNWPLVATRLVWDLGRLFLLGYLASSIAGRGVQMYGAAGRAEAAARSPLE